MIKKIECPILCLFTSVIFIFNSCNGQSQLDNTTISSDREIPMDIDTVDHVNGEVRDIFEMNNILWMATNGDGIYSYDGVWLLNYKNNDIGNSSWLITKSNDHKLWFKFYNHRTAESLYCYFYKGKFYNVQAKSESINSLNYNKEIIFDCKYDGINLSVIKFKNNEKLGINSEINNHIYDIYASLKDVSNTIWLGTCNVGLAKISGSKTQWYTNRELMYPIRAIQRMKNGSVMVGSNGGGVMQYINNAFEPLIDSAKIHDEQGRKVEAHLISRVWSIAEDKNGWIWLSTIDNGLWKTKGELVKQYSGESGFPIDNIWKVFIDSKENVWAGTEGAGLYIMKGEQFEKFSVKKHR